MKDGKWTPNSRFQFTMKNEKWTPNFIFHFSLQMENTQLVSIFNFSFSICDGKYKMGNWNSHENYNAYPGPLAQLLLKMLLSVTQLTESIGGMGMLAPSTFIFQDTRVM